MHLNYDKLKRVIETKGYMFFDNGTYNVNIFGIRNGYDTVNMFDDIIGVAYRDEFNNPVVNIYKATTKPGLHYLKNELGNSKGTAILIPGQYRGCWTLGFHKQYEALVQQGRKIFKVWRDNDSNGKFNPNGKIYEDVTGLNGHTTSFKTEIDKVGRYSAGCQVIQDDLDFHIFLSIIKKSAFLYGDNFSYTLLEMNDF